MKLMKNIAVGSMALLLLLALALCLLVTFSTDGLLPKVLPVQGYAVWDASFEELLPVGSLAIVDPEASMESGHVVWGPEGRLTVADGEGNLILAADPAIVYDQTYGTGRIIYRINGLGAILETVQQNKMILWGILGIGAASAAAWGLNAPKRRRRKEVQELIELFDYYGRKYDAEEEGIDY